MSKAGGNVARDALNSKQKRTDSLFLGSPATEGIRWKTEIKARGVGRSSLPRLPAASKKDQFDLDRAMD